MAKTVRVPALQYLARNSYLNKEKVKQKLIDVALNTPWFNYKPMSKYIFDMAHLKTTPDEIRNAISGLKGEMARKMHFELLPLVDQYISSLNHSFVLPVSERRYSLSRDVSIPFDPQFMYGGSNGLILPVFIFWKRNTFDDPQRSFFATLLREILEQEPDLEEAKVQIVDFSAPKDKSNRTIKIVDLDDVPLMSEEEKNQRLEIFMSALEEARAVLAGEKREEEERREIIVDPRQLRLF